jgi:GDP-4-dehydro-6-deoxy-D-mannose reductase
VRALITGLTGFVGPHLANSLLRSGIEVVGFGARETTKHVLAAIPEAVRIIEGDIRDTETVRRVLRDAQPDQVYHLAAISNIPASFQDPRLTYEVNFGGTVNLFEALHELQMHPRIVVVSSAHVYSSAQNDENCLSEGAPIRLLSPYAASKFMCEALAAHYFEAFGFQVMILRPFNHIGPGQSPDFICSDFARQIALMRRGCLPPVLRTGNLEPQRDFTDVRDVVEAYVIAATRGLPGEIYNVASQVAHSMAEIVSLFSEISDVAIRIETDPAKLRSSEVQRLCGNASKLRALGWAPKIPLTQSLSDVLQYWERNA